MTRSTNSRRWTFAVVISVVILAVTSQSASAAEGDAYLNSCFSRVLTASCSAGTAGSNNLPVLLSPDNNFLYVGLWSGGGTSGNGAPGPRRRSGYRASDAALLHHDYGQRGTVHCRGSELRHAVQHGVRPRWHGPRRRRVRLAPSVRSQPHNRCAHAEGGSRRLLRRRWLHRDPRHKSVLRATRVP